MVIFQDLRQSQSLARSMVVSIGHEVANPLAIALGFTMKIQRAATGEVARDAEKVTAALLRIKEALRRLQRQDSLEETTYADGITMIKTADE